MGGVRRTEGSVTECRNIEDTHPPNCFEMPCFSAILVMVLIHVSAASRSVWASGRFGMLDWAWSSSGGSNRSASDGSVSTERCCGVLTECHQAPVRGVFEELIPEGSAAVGAEG